jgi:excisionase family DNA binding protein
MEALPLSVSFGRAASMLDISRTKLYQLVKDGVIPAFYIDKRHLISVERLRQWIDDQHKKDDASKCSNNAGKDDAVVK